MDLISKIEMISNALEDRKGYDIKKLDVRNVSPMCDAFVIVSGNNKNQK